MAGNKTSNLHENQKNVECNGSVESAKVRRGFSPPTPKHQHPVHQPRICGHGRRTLPHAVALLHAHLDCPRRVCDHDLQLVVVRGWLSLGARGHVGGRLGGVVHRTGLHCAAGDQAHPSSTQHAEPEACLLGPMEVGNGRMLDRAWVAFNVACVEEAGGTRTTGGRGLVGLASVAYALMPGMGGGLRKVTWLKIPHRGGLGHRHDPPSHPGHRSCAVGAARDVHRGADLAF